LVVFFGENANSAIELSKIDEAEVSDWRRPNIDYLEIQAIE
jgi:hypothetical protein